MNGIKVSFEGGTITQSTFCTKKKKELIYIKECFVDNRMKLNKKLNKIKLSRYFDY